MAAIWVNCLVMLLKKLVHRISVTRDRLLWRYARRRLKRHDFTVISDDCWAGRFYSDLGLKCHSPCVGTGFTAREYLDFLKGFREPGALDVRSVSSEERGYPIIQLRDARLFGRHYSSDDVFLKGYERRRKTILWDRVFVKIDFGNPKYQDDDIERWNAMKLPNAVALYPDTPRFRSMNIHQGVALPDYHANGARQFRISCRRFDIFEWLNTGKLALPLGYRCVQLALMEKAYARRWSRWFSNTKGDGA